MEPAEGRLVTPVRGISPYLDPAPVETPRQQPDLDKRTLQADRDAAIPEVRGPDGGPLYLVRSTSDGHIGLIFPGPDAVIEHHAHSKA
jgi:Domain of unknown function (DUF1918)